MVDFHQTTSCIPADGQLYSPPKCQVTRSSRPVSGLASFDVPPSQELSESPSGIVERPHSLTVAGAAGELQQILLRTPFPFHLWLMIEPKTPVAVCPALLLGETAPDGG
jgi:hypothetical protein